MRSWSQLLSLLQLNAIHAAVLQHMAGVGGAAGAGGAPGHVQIVYLIEGTWMEAWEWRNRCNMLSLVCCLVELL